MRVLITGGGGALAQVLAPYLSEQGCIVTLLDNRRINSELQTITADIRDKESLKLAMKNQDYVIHTAALHGIHIGKYDDKDFFDVNIIGTYNVLKQAKLSGIKRVIYVGSTSVYGISKRTFLEETVLVNEDNKFSPLDINDLCKVQCEQICEYFRKNFSLDCINLRVGRFFVDNLIDFNLTKLVGGVDLLDVSQAIYKALRIKNNKNHTFCISSKVPFNKEDCEKLITEADEVIERYYPGTKSLFYSLGKELPKSVHRIVSIERAETELGYSPIFNFDLFLAELESEMIERKVLL
ncbi:NAD(P)-dependent oxidoreductase [Psychrobacillus sp. PGGUH221]|uniref:NAD-dependent epimerase/dehydratase family protein n=1 Tax=Psychrobacillus sp. PGGUH221 TaxID=3020058 RepID=UPI0035C69347